MFKTLSKIKNKLINIRIKCYSIKRKKYFESEMNKSEIKQEGTFPVIRQRKGNAVSKTKFILFCLDSFDSKGDFKIFSFTTHISCAWFYRECTSDSSRRCMKTVEYWGQGIFFLKKNREQKHSCHKNIRTVLNWNSQGNYFQRVAHFVLKINNLYVNKENWCLKYN